MAPSKPTLWRNIEGYAFDDPKAERPFSARLAEEEGWSAEDTHRVIAEYRRFLYLAQIMDVPLAPPGPIDAVWRRHLLYTRDYWERFVPEVLKGRALHRAAATVADSDAQRAFHKALRPAYRHAFGEDPPRDIWVHPLRPDMGGLIVLFMITGFFGAFLAFGLGWAVSRMLGMEFGGEIKTFPEKAATVIFVLCWALMFFSPLWAWIVTRWQNRLPVTKKGKGRWSSGISISVVTERS